MSSSAEFERAFGHHLHGFDHVGVASADIPHVIRTLGEHDGGGRHGVDEDAVLGHFVRESQGVAIQGGLGRAVGPDDQRGLFRIPVGDSRLIRGGAADVEDPSGAPLTHGGDRLLGEVHRGVDVEVVHEAAVFVTGLARQFHARARGIVHQDIDGAECLGGSGNQVAPGAGVREISGDCRGLASVGFDLRHRILEGALEISVGTHARRRENDRRALCG